MLHWEVFVSGTEDGDEMFLEGMYGPFGGIATMIVWWDKLEVNVTESHELFHFIGSFVVQSLEFGSESTFDEAVGEFLVGAEELCAFSGFERFDQDDVGVIRVEDHDVLVPFG